MHFRAPPPPDALRRAHVSQFRERWVLPVGAAQPDVLTSEAAKTASINLSRFPFWPSARS